MGSRSRLISVSKSIGFPTTRATLCLSSPRRRPTLPQGKDRVRPGRGGVHRRACRYGRTPVGVPPSAPPAVWLRRLRALSRRGNPIRVRHPSTVSVQTPRSRRAKSRGAAPRWAPSFDSPAPPGGFPAGSGLTSLLSPFGLPPAVCLAALDCPPSKTPPIPWRFSMSKGGSGGGGNATIR